MAIERDLKGETAREIVETQVQALQTKYHATKKLRTGNKCGFCQKVFETLNSVALVRERTIPTERPPPVGEVSANFLRIEGCHVVSATSPHSR